MSRHRRPNLRRPCVEGRLDAGPARSFLQQRLPLVVAHELHHAVRWRGPGRPFTLLEWLAFEGLADRFAIELLGTPLQPWSQAFPESETDFYLELARPDFDNAAFDYQGWFFGADPRRPRREGWRKEPCPAADRRASSHQSSRFPWR